MYSAFDYTGFSQKNNRTPAIAEVLLSGREASIHAVTVGGAVVAGQCPTGVLQGLPGAVPDILQDIASVVQQAAVGIGTIVGFAVCGTVVIVGGAVIGAPVVGVGSGRSVVTGGIFAGGGTVAVLVVTVSVVPSAGG